MIPPSPAPPEAFAIETAALLANTEIEASAGTGKTYTLEQIVCRLVESHGIPITQILLVTFTEKAAQELRERIRRRLSLRLAECSSQPAKAPLLEALSNFERSNISTIHSFFRRILDQYPLEAGLNPQSTGGEIQQDLKPLMEPLLDELRRSNWSGEDQEAYQAISRLKSTGSFRDFLSYCCDAKLHGFWYEHPHYQLFPGAKELSEFRQLESDFARQTGPLYQAFLALSSASWPPEVFDFKLGRKKLKLMPPGYKPSDCAAFFAQLAQFRSAPLRQLLDFLWQEGPPQVAAKATQKEAKPYIALLAMLSSARITQENQDRMDILEAWPYQDRIDGVDQFFSALLPFADRGSPETPVYQYVLANQLLLHLRSSISPKLRRAMQIQGIRNYNDMTEILYQVLVLENQGDSASLLSALHKRYRVALIDEFQDTDPSQWEVLYKIFGTGAWCSERERERNYIIVGDPKQSIYRFRGASRALYTQVQEHCDFHYRLGANYRSHEKVIAACNHVFSRIWEPDIFEPVHTGKEEPPPALRLPELSGGTDAAGLEFLRIPPADSPAAPGGGEKAKKRFSDARKDVQHAFAYQILELLCSGYRLGQRKVRPADIAILMQSKKECDQMQSLLQTLGIPAVLEESRNLFSDPSAQALLFFLLSLLEPRNANYTKRLFLSCFFELHPNELVALEATDFWNHLIIDLLEWRELSDRGLLGAAIEGLFAYGRRLRNALQSAEGEGGGGAGGEWTLAAGGRSEWEHDTFYRILARPQFAPQFVAGSPQAPRAASAASAKRSSNEQAYTNLRHLLEILYQEQASSKLDTQGLADFLSYHIQQAQEEEGGPGFGKPGRPRASSQSAAYQQRMNSAGNAVQIMTIHKSKGLEFPIVFLDFGIRENCYHMPKNPHSEKLLLFHQIHFQEATQSLQISQYADSSFHSDSLSRFDRESCAEQRRLFYVGMTRAVSKVYLPLQNRLYSNNNYSSLMQEILHINRDEILAKNLWSGEETLFVHLFASRSQGSQGDPKISGGDEQILTQTQKMVEAYPDFLALSPAKLEAGQLSAPLHELQARLRQSLLEERLGLGEESQLHIGQQSGPGAPPKAKTAKMAETGIRHFAAAAGLQRRFPAVSSFTSLLRQIEASKGPQGAESPAAPQQGSGGGPAFDLAFDTENSLGSTRDKEHDDFPDSPDSLRNDVSSASQQLWEGEREPEGESQGELERTEGPKPDTSESAGPSNGEPGQWAQEMQWHELWLSPGAELGNLLHELLEQVDYQLAARCTLEEFMESDELYQLVSHRSRRYFPRHWAERAFRAVARLLWRTLRSQLAPGLRLCDLTAQQRRHELEFLLVVPDNCLLKLEQFSLAKQGKFILQKGYLKGFIDLLFFYQGKIYLLDWKSNRVPIDENLAQYRVHAGPFDEAAIDRLDKLDKLQEQLYCGESLAEMMQSHFYPMQYMIYLAVIYYYLKQTMGSTFQYELHFGGCYYIFLRGMSESHGGGIFYTKPEELLVQNILKEISSAID